MDITIGKILLASHVQGCEGIEVCDSTSWDSEN